MTSKLNENAFFILPLIQFSILWVAILQCGVCACESVWVCRNFKQFGVHTDMEKDMALTWGHMALMWHDNDMAWVKMQ